MPSPVDDEDPRLGRQAATPRSPGAAVSCAVGQDRLELAVDLLELVRLDVDERHVRVRGGDRLDPVERRAALRVAQNFGVAKTSTNGSLGGQRVGDRGLVERRHRLVVGRDLRHVAADVGEGRRVRRRRRVADADDRARSGRTSKVHPDRLRRGVADAAVVNSAPHSPARRQVDVRDVHADARPRSPR